MSRSQKLSIDPSRGRFLDALGREVFLHGVNVGGRSKRPPFLPFDLDASAPTSALMERARELLVWLPRWGLDTVRLPFVWEAIEPTRGDYDTRQLDAMRALLDVANELSLRVILDMHQDLFAAALGGDGMPTWALPEDLRHASTPDRRHWFLGYLLDPRVSDAFDRFWDDEEELLLAFEQVWRVVLEHLGDHEAVIGYELLNEPGWGTREPASFEREVWLPLCERLGRAFANEYPELVQFYGVPGIHALEPWRHERFPRHDRVCFAPHFYDPALLAIPLAGATTDPDDALGHLARLRREAGVPIFIGEFGCTHRAVGGDDWLDAMLAGMARLGISGALWELSLGASRWNREDLCLLSPTSTPRPLAATIARPRLAALAGDLEMVLWERDTRRFIARWFSNGNASTINLPGVTSLDACERFEVIGDDVEVTLDTKLMRLHVSAPPHECVEVEIILPEL